MTGKRGAYLRRRRIVFLPNRSYETEKKRAVVGRKVGLNSPRTSSLIRPESISRTDQTGGAFTLARQYASILSLSASTSTPSASVMEERKEAKRGQTGPYLLANPRHSTAFV